MLKDDSLFKNAEFYHKLLVEERRSKMDINYWLDYIVKFGVKDLIPKYDHMSAIEFRNLDVYLLLWSAAFIVLCTIS